MAALEDRLQLLEDRAAILALKAYYARCADEKYTDDHRRKPQAEIDAITRRQVDATFTPRRYGMAAPSSAPATAARRSTTTCAPAAGTSRCITSSAP